MESTHECDTSTRGSVNENEFERKARGRKEKTNHIFQGVALELNFAHFFWSVAVCGAPEHGLARGRAGRPIHGGTDAAEARRARAAAGNI